MIEYFADSAKMGTCLAVHSPVKDGEYTWRTISPFITTLGVGEEYFILSPSAGGSLQTGKLLSDRLSSIGDFSNEISLIAKSAVNKKEKTIVNPVGGFSKFKDFNFSIIAYENEGVNIIFQSQNIQDFYGRKVTLYLTKTGLAEDIDSEESVILFTGQIFSVDRDTKSISFTVRGILDSDEPLVQLDTFTNLDGDLVSDTLLIGDREDEYVKLHKVKDRNGFIFLRWNKGDHSLIEDLFVKVEADGEDIHYFPIDNKYRITADRIDLREVDSPQATLVSAINSTTDSITINSYYLIALRLTNYVVGQLTEGTVINIKRRRYIGGYQYALAGTLEFVEDRLIEFDTGISFYTQIFKAPCNMKVTSLLSGLIDPDGETVPGSVECRWSLQDSYIPANSWRPNSFTILEEPAVLKALDWMPWSWSFETANMTTSYEYVARVRNSMQSFKTFNSIPKKGLVISINNENMLVVQASTHNTPNVTPTRYHLKVIRGWDNTIRSNHAANTSVYTKSEREQRVRYNIIRPLQSITAASALEGWSFSGYENFLNGIGDLTVQPNKNMNPYVGHLGLDFNLPDISADIVKLYLTGRGRLVIFNPAQKLLTSSAITLAANYLEESSFDNCLNAEQRRAIGLNKYSHNPFFRPALLHSPPPANPSGFYRLDFQGKSSPVNILELSHRDLSAGYSYYSSYSGDKSFAIKNLSDLRDTSLFLTFQNVGVAEDGGSASTSYADRPYTVFNISRPTLEITAEMDISSANIYAKIINKPEEIDIIDIISPIGSNCKISLDNEYPEKGFCYFVIHDEDLLGFDLARVSSNGFFTRPAERHKIPTDLDLLGEGVLTKDQRPKFELRYSRDSYEILTTKVKGVSREYFYFEPEAHGVDYDNPNLYLTEIRQRSASGGSVDVGNTLIRWNDIYIFVDQDNNRIVSFKASYSNNPVTIIENLLTTYGGSNVSINTTSFDVARALRADFKATVRVESDASLRTLINQIASEHSLIVYENNIGQVEIIALETPSVDDDTLEVLTDESIQVRRNAINFTEKYTDLDYIITELDVYYNKSGNKYRGLVKSTDLPQTGAFEKAIELLSGNSRQFKLQLDTVKNSIPAVKAGLIKSLFNFIPVRMIDVRCFFGVADWTIGKWVTSSSSHIFDVNGKKFIVVGISIQVPMPNTKPYVRLKILEFNGDNISLRIQEVPKQTINENYTEVITDVNSIEEVPNAGE